MYQGTVDLVTLMPEIAVGFTMILGFLWLAVFHLLKKAEQVERLRATALIRRANQPLHISSKTTLGPYGEPGLPCRPQREREHAPSNSPRGWAATHALSIPAANDKSVGHPALHLTLN